MIVRCLARTSHTSWCQERLVAGACPVHGQRSKAVSDEPKPERRVKSRKGKRREEAT